MISTLKILATLARVFGVVAAFNSIPGVDLKTSVLIFGIAQVLHDLVDHIGDFLDNGKSDWRSPLVTAAALTCALSLAGLTACSSSGGTAGGSASGTPSAMSTGTVTTGTIQPISATDLALIQTGASVATSASLDFAIKQVSTRTRVANEVYASAVDLAVLTGPNGTTPTPAQLTTTLNVYDQGGDAQYTHYVTALSGLYSAYYAKFTTGSITASNLSAVLHAIALGAQAASSAYATVQPAPVTGTISL
jgi:hypothetical protein